MMLRKLEAPKKKKKTSKNAAWVLFTDSARLTTLPQPLNVNIGSIYGCTEHRIAVA